MKGRITDDFRFAFLCFSEWSVINLNYLFIKKLHFKRKNLENKIWWGTQFIPPIKLKQFYFFLRVERTNKRLIDVHDWSQISSQIIVLQTHKQISATKKLIRWKLEKDQLCYNHIANYLFRQFKPLSLCPKVDRKLCEPSADTHPHTPKCGTTLGGCRQITRGRPGQGASSFFPPHPHHNSPSPS